MKVASYCRVSTDREDQANSFEAQQRYFREYIERMPGWQLYAVYADEGISGTSTRKRTQFNRMIADAYAGKFQLILTKEISRFSRNILDTLSYTRRLKAIGVGVLFMTENLNSLHPEAEMLLSFMGTMAQEESRRTSIRVKWGQTRQMERGVVFGRSMLGYDVKDGRITVNPEGAQLVQLIFRKYGIEKKGTSTIARELRNAGYRTRSGNPNWSASHIIKILKNEKYVGDLVQKKTITPDYLTHAKKANHGEENFIILKDHHPPIISRALWNTVQSEMSARNKHRGAGHSQRYIFSGKIRCGECGAGFLGRQQTRRDGPKIRRWRCATAVSGGSGGCSVGKLLRDDDAMNMLATAFAGLQLNTGAVIRSVSELAAEVRRLDAQAMTPSQLQRRIDQLERKKAAAMDACFAGDISTEEMRTMKAGYDDQLRDMRCSLEAAEKVRTSDQDEAIGQLLSSILSGETVSEGFCKSILDYITVFKDRHLELRLLHLPQVFHFLG